MQETWITLGKLGRPKGLEGELYLDLYNPDSVALDSHPEIQIGKSKKFQVEEIRSVPKRLVIKFRGIDDVEAAKELVGEEISIHREALPKLPKDEFYICDLLGAIVQTETGERLGTLDSVLSTASNDVYVVKQGKKESLFAAVPEVVLSIDAKDRIITVRPPEVLHAF